MIGVDRLETGKIKKALEQYALATDTPVCLMDQDGAILYSSNGRKRCAFCDKISALLPDCPDCARVFKYGGYEARRFGGQYIFFCPMGLTHWAASIMKDGAPELTAIGGPVLMVDLDEFIEIDLASKVAVPQEAAEKLRTYAETIKRVEPRTVTALSEQLFYTAAFCSEGDNRFFFESRQRQDNQAKVSEYIHYIKSMSADYWEPSYPLEKEKELLGYIAAGNREASQALLNEILGYILFKSGNDLDTIKARALELIVVLSRAAIEGGGDAESIFGWNYAYIHEIRAIQTVDGLTDWLNGVMKRFSEAVFESADIKHIDAIYKAIRYIRENYMKKITLEEVAQYVHFSPSYFSKIFKDETGSAFNLYLNRIRVENSKRLLMDNSISLVDVANIVGFEDQSYYSKVFKKITGKTPGRYREARGKK